MLCTSNGLFAQFLTDTGTVGNVVAAIDGDQHIIMLTNGGKHRQCIPLQALT